MTVLSSIYSIPILVLLVVLCKYPQRSSRYRSTTIVAFSIAGAKVRLSFKPASVSATFFRNIFRGMRRKRPFLTLIKAIKRIEKGYVKMRHALPSRVLPDLIRHPNRVHLVETLRATSPKIPSGKSLRRSTLRLYIRQPFSIIMEI